MSGLAAVTLLVATLVAFVAMLIGLAMLLFRPGRRKRGLTIFLGAPLVWAGLIVAMMSWDARQKGFEGIGDKGAAGLAGIEDPAEWAEIRAARRAEEAAEKAARQEAEAAEKAERERTAAEARAAAAAEKAARRQAEAAKKAEQERIAADAKAAAEAEDRRKGFHCLSGWDGSHPAFKRIVKNSMRDPDSFEHVDTLVGPVTNGWHAIRMVYRARNGFGGMNVGEAIGRYRNDDCSVEVLSLE
ncbi:hypothetical protein DSD19_06130 [Rhodovulum sp. BSW8]|nr:hypothetical protein DSD19_06130 [Rhodovulum sp. BSW8]